MPHHIPFRRNPAKLARGFGLADLGAKSRKPNRAILTIMWTKDALAVPRWRDDVLAILTGTAVNRHGERTGAECLTCKRAWHARQLPAAIVVAELLPLRLNVLAGICRVCAERGDARYRIYAELERELKLDPATARPVHPEART